MLLIGPNSRLYRRLVSLRGGNRPLIKRLLAEVTTACLEALRQIIHRQDITTIKRFQLFSPPYDSGPDKTIAALAVQSANQTFPFIVHFIEVINQKHFSEPTPITLFSNTVSARSAAMELKSMFDRHGSDKGTFHNYHHLYGAILQDRRGSTVTMLEIGLGTNYLDVASNMGSGGRPGASLRAFAEFLPLGCIYGADIDRRVLFQEARIKTFFVDQTRLDSFRSLACEVNCKFDLIIDDGLHSPNANIATLSFACDNLKEGGWFVVEDIQSAAIPVWRVISALLPTNYKSWIIAAEGGFLFVIRRNEPQ
jgi:SAM-dependent methyltransferase